MTNRSSRLTFDCTNRILGHAYNICKRRACVIASSSKSDEIKFADEKDVLVYLGDHDGIRQPRTFQLCPLGVQLYTCEPVQECCLIDLTLTLPTADGLDEEQVTCTGLVAQCLPSQNGTQLFRIWVKFLDLAPETIERIRVLTADRKFTCPFCINF